jgi:hypothetical protein
MSKWNSDQKIMCSTCAKRPAIIKYNRLCSRCESKRWRTTRGSEFSETKISDPTIRKFQHKAEILFSQSHPSCLYQPTNFYFNGGRYTPDFYDPMNNRFYEVIGSRQRFEQLKYKIKKFREIFPNIDLILCYSDGKPYRSTKNQDLVDAIK